MLAEVYVMLIVISLLATFTVNGYAMSYGPSLGPTLPHFYDAKGERLQSIDEGQQVMITTTFTNYLEEEVEFIGILEVRDGNGVSLVLAWQSAAVEPLGNKTMGVSWVVPEPGAYQSRTFAFTNLENPQVLSVVESVEISSSRN